MNKQAYFKMMNGGLSKKASLQQQQLLYKLAMMHKQQGAISDWWNKEGNSIRGGWQKLLQWIKNLFAAKKQKAPSTESTPGNQTTTQQQGDQVNPQGYSNDYNGYLLTNSNEHYGDESVNNSSDSSVTP